MLKYLALLVLVFGLSAATLEWDESPSPHVKGYRVYYGENSRNYTTVVDVTNSLRWLLTSVPTNILYFYSVTAYDRDGLESVFSEEISYKKTNAPGTLPPTVPIGVMVDRIELAK